MHNFVQIRLHRETERLDRSIRGAFVTAGSLIVTVLTIIVLFFGVFLERSK